MLNHRVPYGVEGKYRGTKVVLATTGIGGGNVEERVSSMVESCRPDLLISLGYAGAASEELKVGDLVLCSRASFLGDVLETHPDVAGRHEISTDPVLEDLAVEAFQLAELVFHKGGCVTVTRLVGDPEAKRRIGNRWGVLAIDMEGCWMAQAAASRSLPFLGIRAITDTVTQRLPDLSGLIDGDGGISVLGSLAHALGHPTDIYPMARLGWHSRLASRNLTRFALSFLTLPGQSERHSKKGAWN
ncbi:MAG: hypothetical protein IIB11_02555 [Chloroflexi bacterium]|nr:hypothetical protein [Chloroflexota bacterium]